MKKNIATTLQVYVAPLVKREGRAALTEEGCFFLFNFDTFFFFCAACVVERTMKIGSCKTYLAMTLCAIATTLSTDCRWCNVMPNARAVKE